jgi:site-specific recombinase XerD
MGHDKESPFFFTCKSSRTSGRPYTDRILQKIWKAACVATGENISLYAGLKHSSCCQYINEKGLSLTELQVLTDHARLESVKHYAQTETTRKRELWAGKTGGNILPFKPAKNS